MIKPILIGSKGLYVLYIDPLAIELLGLNTSRFIWRQTEGHAGPVVRNEALDEVFLILKKGKILQSGRGGCVGFVNFVGFVGFVVFVSFCCCLFICFFVFFCNTLSDFDLLF